MTLRRKLFAAVLLSSSLLVCGVLVRMTGTFLSRRQIARALVPVGSQSAAETLCAGAGSARPIYPYSLIPGGACSGAEIEQALKTNPILAAHYAGIHPRELRLARLRSPIIAHVSYLKGGQIYWTARQVRLSSDEYVLTDGVNHIRARCGNRISMTARTPTAPAEDIVRSAMDRPQPPLETPSTNVVNKERETGSPTWTGRTASSSAGPALAHAGSGQAGGMSSSGSGAASSAPLVTGAAGGIALLGIGARTNGAPSNPSTPPVVPPGDSPSGPVSDPISEPPSGKPPGNPSAGPSTPLPDSPGNPSSGPRAPQFHPPGDTPPGPSTPQFHPPSDPPSSPPAPPVTPPGNPPSDPPSPPVSPPGNPPSDPPSPPANPPSDPPSNPWIPPKTPNDPPLAVTPEPGTLVLFAGALGVYGTVVALRRSRCRKEDRDPTRR